jgi:hypothetical protein
MLLLAVCLHLGVMRMNSGLEEHREEAKNSFSTVGAFEMAMTAIGARNKDTMNDMRLMGG